MFLKLKNDHFVQGFFHGSFQNIESTDRESMEIHFKFNPCHYLDDDITFCFEANITDDLRLKLKGFGVDIGNDVAQLQFYLYQNGEIGSCS